MRAARHIFFDLDGTLTDSCTGIIRCVNHALEEIGCAAEPDDRLRGMIGQPLTAIFGAVMSEAGDELIDRAIAAYRVRFDDVGIFENAVYPGIPDALHRLRREGYRLQIVTAKPAVTASRVLAHFQIDQYFDAVHGPELTDRGCDKAALLGRALAETGSGWRSPLGLAAASVMIGDRVDDMLAARAHGVRAIGAGWGYGSRKELIDAGAMHVAADVEEVLAYLRHAAPPEIAPEIILDVRSRREFESGHVPGARHLPFWAAVTRGLPAAADTPLTVYCGHGPRAWLAKAAFRARGFRRVRLLAGHMRAWKKAGRPLE